MSDLAIIPECYVDTNLIETLVPTKQGYNHQKGCGTVSSRMRKQLRDAFALGIIDKDKKDIDYLKEFDEVCPFGSLTLHKHKQKHHYIIQIAPAIERFLMKAAADSGISLNYFGLPEDFEELKHAAKNTKSKNDDRFKSLFKALRKEGNADILKLQVWVAYLKEKRYDAAIEELKQL